MTRETWSRGGGCFAVPGARRCRALTNLALVIAGQLPESEREAAYRRILRTLRDHIGEPEGAAAAIAELLADIGPRVA
jgi:lauroyl/myristoyl acyltransferase